ncbi:hypothetical protein BVRB_041900, partial [Beta vulgaris subsp. vulgaris]
SGAWFLIDAELCQRLPGLNGRRARRAVKNLTSLSRMLLNFCLRP